jgi:hypothetical protein
MPKNNQKYIGMIRWAAFSEVSKNADILRKDEDYTPQIGQYLEKWRKVKRTKTLYPKINSDTILRWLKNQLIEIKIHTKNG